MTPFFGVSEDIQWRTAQALESSQNFERRQHPPTECHLARRAGQWISAREQRRCQMKLELIVPVKCILNLALESAVRIEPRDFVLILVGHHFEGRSCDDEGEPLILNASFLNCKRNTLEQFSIPRCIPATLIRLQLIRTEPRQNRLTNRAAKPLHPCFDYALTFSSTAVRSRAARRPQRNAC